MRDVKSDMHMDTFTHSHTCVSDSAMYVRRVEGTIYRMVVCLKTFHAHVSRSEDTHTKHVVLLEEEGQQHTQGS